MNSTSSKAEWLPVPLPEQCLQESQPLLEQALLELEASDSASASHRGRPLEVSWMHLWLGLLTAAFEGMDSYQDWWRLMCSQAIGPFDPLDLTDDALIKRLRQAGLQPLLDLLHHVSSLLAPRLAELPTTQLAPFAHEILALDETTLDAVMRHLPSLRPLRKGEPGLLAGKLAGRFNIRTQQWDFVQFRANAQANCKVEILSLLEGVPLESLLLFDLGYFSFAWFDYLTQAHYWYVTRLREKICYQLIHTFYRDEGTLDALVWLGSSHGARAGYPVRLVRFHDGHGLRTYLSNVLDPRRLSLADIARLYARRWDIELAILTVKEYLGMHHWWSGQPILIWQQLLLTLLLAQLFQAWRVLAAACAGVDVFEISLPLLIKYMPRLIQQQQDPLAWLLEYGRPLHIIRPSSRLEIVAPQIPLEQLSWPPEDLPTVRRARYPVYHPRPHKPSPKQRAKKRAQAASAGSPSAGQPP